MFVCPAQYTLGALELTAPLPEFNSCKLYVGGDVGGGEVHMLHTRGNLAGCVEVVKVRFVCQGVCGRKGGGERAEQCTPLLMGQ